MNIHLLGASSTSGIAFQKLIELSEKKYKIFSYSSRNFKMNYLDLKNCRGEKLLENESPSILVSFAPIWYLSNFLKKEFKNNTSTFKNVIGFVICSSSSSVTKKFSSNIFDNELSSKISDSENYIFQYLDSLDKKCIIIQPTMIYGSIDKLKDKNISKIIKFIKFFPFILLPNKTGLRQPIHIYQLARVVLHFTELIACKKRSFGKYNLKKLLLGGDEEISYEKMIKRIISYLKKENNLKFCMVFTLPNRIFLFLLSPLILFSPKIFSAIQRINTNLSGFEKASTFTKEKNHDFPMEPFL